MHLTINEKNKIVEVWLSLKESNDPFIDEVLSPIYKKYKSTKYMVVVYKSGSEDCFDSFLNLALANKVI